MKSGSLEEMLVNLISEKLPFAENDPVKLLNLIETIRRNLVHWSNVFKRGHARNRSYAALLLEYLPHFSSPIVIQEGSKIHNGSGCFIATEESFVLTNNHVVEYWFQLKREGRAPKMIIKNMEIDVDKLIIDRDDVLDLATIRIPENTRRDLFQLGVNFFRPNELHFQNVDVKENDVVYIVGYPGSLRDDNTTGGVITSSIVTIAAAIVSVDDRKFLVEFDTANWEKIMGEHNIEDMTDLGGFSGSPTFLFQL